MAKADEVVMGTIVWDYSKGEGKIHFTTHHRDADSVVSLDAIKDWLAALDAEYLRQMERGYHQWEEAQRRKTEG